VALHTLTVWGRCPTCICATWPLTGRFAAATVAAVSCTRCLHACRLATTSATSPHVAPQPGRPPAVAAFRPPSSRRSRRGSGARATGRARPVPSVSGWLLLNKFLRLQINPTFINPYFWGPFFNQADSLNKLSEFFWRPTVVPLPCPSLFHPCPSPFRILHPAQDVAPPLEHAHGAGACDGPVRPHRLGGWP
jgi:hypothetical protein